MRGSRLVTDDNCPTTDDNFQTTGDNCLEIGGSRESRSHERGSWVSRPFCSWVTRTCYLNCDYANLIFDCGMRVTGTYDSCTMATCYGNRCEAILIDVVVTVISLVTVISWVTGIS